MQLWKCERLTTPVLEQMCATCMGHIPFNSTHQTNLGHTSFECGEIAGLKRTSCSMKQTVQVILDLYHTFHPQLLVTGVSILSAENH